MRFESYNWNNARLCLTAAGLVAIAVLLVTEDSNARTHPLAPRYVAPKNSTQQLQNSVHRLNAWLSESNESADWREPLLLNVLDTQSALGEQADIATLYSVLQRFETNAGDLDQPAFRDVRVALAQQINHLSSGRVNDLFAAVTTARGQYQPITIAEMERQRDRARYELQLIIEHYRATMSSRDRANLFYDMQLDQVIDYLGQIKFELAPEISVGKMTSMIRGVQDELDVIIKEIDALPFEPIPEDGDAPKKPDEPQDEVPLDTIPAPDEEKRSLQDLNKEKVRLQTQIQELKDQRLAIARADKPRRDLRNKTLQQLGQYELNLVNVLEVQGDPYLVSAASSFERFVRTYFYGTLDNLQEDFLKKLEELETDLLELDLPDAREAAGQVGDHLQWMENANQVPNLVTSIRARYSNPNIYVSFSSRMLNEIGSQTVSESSYVRESIDGRLVRGNLNTNARVNIELQNEPNQVHASIHLVGDLTTSTYIEQGKIRAFAATNGQLEGRRSIFANLGGLYATSPQVAAHVNADFLGTNSPLKIVNRIASRKFDELRDKTERGAAPRVEDQLRDQFEEQTRTAIDNGIESLADLQFRLNASTNVNPEVYLRSFTSEIMAVGKKSSISTLGAQGVPAPNPIMPDVSVRVHDSLGSNFLDKTFSRKTFTDQELADKIGSMLGQEPETLTESDTDGKDESFSITFAEVRPIQIEFENNGISVVVSGRRFAQADKRIDEGLKIILKFRIKQIGDRLMFVREGQAEIEYLNPELNRPATVAFRSFLMGKLNPEQGTEKQIEAELPDNLLPIDEMEALQDSEIAKRMVLVQCRAENGWLYLGWNHRAENAYPVWQVDTPAIWTEAVITDMQPSYLQEPLNEDVPPDPEVIQNQ